MEYISTKEASAKWGISTIRITILANEGRIPGAKKLGKSWLIPAGATKPLELRPGQAAHVKKNINDFSFPLYHFRPDWNYNIESELSKVQQLLLQAGNAVLECRFADALPLLDSILKAPDDKITEIGCLWYKAICCLALNMPDDFLRTYLRIQLVFSEDFSHKDDMMVILNAINTYIESVSSIANSYDYIPDIHYQCLPMACLNIGYANLTREAMKPGITDIHLLELNLQFLKATGSVVAVGMMHCYLVGIYHFRNEVDAVQKHANAVIKIAYDYKLYFPLVTYYEYFSQVFSPILSQYPEDFQNHISDMVIQYEKNSNAFLESIGLDSVLSKLVDEDYPYIYGILMDLSNTAIAGRTGVHTQTVKNKIIKLCKKFNVNSKKELKDYLHSYM